MSTVNITPEEKEELQSALKRCPEGTLEAAILYRESRDTQHLPQIILGIIQRFIEPEFREKLSDEGQDSLRLIEDLGIDSLTMMEVVILVEEVVEVSFDNEELKDLRTIGDVRTYMECKIGGKPLPEKSLFVPVEEIMAIMPQQSPFLFVQDAQISGEVASGTYVITGKENFLEGHFKGNPVFPASILLEALGQLGVLYLLKAPEGVLPDAVRADSIYFTSCDGVRCHRMCKPGDRLELSVRLLRARHPLAAFQGSITVNGEKAAFAEEITLTFDY